VLSHYAWPGGLALVIETPRQRFAAVLEPGGWRLGDARDVWRAGPPATATVTTLELPAWLERQLSALEFAQLGLHTDFVRLNRVLARLQSEHANGALVILGPQPAALVLTHGAPTVVYPTGREGEYADMVVARASGWVCVLAGPVAIGDATEDRAPMGAPIVMPTAAPMATPHAAPPEVAAPATDVPTAPLLPAAAPVADAPEPRQPEPAVPDPPKAAPPATPPVPAAPAPAPVVPTSGVNPGDRFVAAAGARTLSEDVAGQVTAVAGERGPAIIALLDGSRTIQEIADAVSLTPDHVGQVVRVLAGVKLAFRYVSRVRAPSSARGPG
jgi:hypothetical protein